MTANLRDAFTVPLFLDIKLNLMEVKNMSRINCNLSFAEIWDVLTASITFHRPMFLRDVSD